MQWDYFIWFAFASVACWTIAAILAYKPHHYRKTVILSLLGILIFSVFIGGMWLSLERPPMRTMGETRLWYSFFLPVAGLLTYVRWKHKWTFSFSTLLSFVFICVNLLRPEIHSKALMPALQSPWFVPHVIVYMFAYALFGVATVIALFFMIRQGKSDKQGKPDKPTIALCDNLVYLGTAFLTVGMLFGAIWAKAAWGHYWSWDPKETWAAATWAAYLLYIHFRLHRPAERKTALYLLIVAFIILQICWFGVNYLPSAQGNSVHVYG
jgi:ABC-type transport system involved in cytochrome c biogenesis permease subunit